MRAMTDPVDKNQMWTLNGTERMEFVRDAIRSTRAYDFTLVLDAQPTVTKAMVDAARPAPVEEDEAPPPPPPKSVEKVDREDLYTDNWWGGGVSLTPA